MKVNERTSEWSGARKKEERKGPKKATQKKEARKRGVE
jgi:hypothetical protein